MLPLFSSALDPSSTSSPWPWGPAESQCGCLLTDSGRFSKLSISMLYARLLSMSQHPFNVHLGLPDAFAACQPAYLMPISLLEGFLKIEPLPPTLNPPTRSTRCHSGLQNATGHDNKLWLPWNRGLLNVSGTTSESPSRPAGVTLGRGHYHECGVGVRVVVGQVADILTVREGDGKGEGIITLPRRAPDDSGPLPVMVSARERRREENEGAAGETVVWGSRRYKPLALYTGKVFIRNTMWEKFRKQRNVQVSLLPGHEPNWHHLGWSIWLLIVVSMPRAFPCCVWK